ncbi:hypothetical protein O9G_003693 [Rozella allomycis CSF55]|uniref:Uncharacterized protein n=1 Tax=Rozella allomycis (strain CSF55) TaxID=988480 RepID=A0A075AZ69_ROZAC|nr:hypothetical protein O9G_003693 [Rozella allomycis CSF55]|eukprot:EPZ35434.1 hypothetical protein O9G_003693 [Rozella allomycis CSF55]
MLRCKGIASASLDRKAKLQEDRRLNIETFGKAGTFDNNRRGRGRRLNVETFGKAGTLDNKDRGRGRGRGQRGRGSHHRSNEN